MGGNNFRLLRQACQTLPKVIASPSRLTSNLTLQCNPYNDACLSKQQSCIYAVSLVGLVMFSVAFDKLVYGEGKYYQPHQAP